MRTFSLTSIRRQIYKVFDQVIETGKPVYVKRKGRIIKIDLDKPVSRTERLFSQKVRKDVINGDPESLVNFKTWQWDEKV